MSVFDHIPMGEKGLREIYSWVDVFVKKNEKFAEKKVLGKSFLWPRLPSPPKAFPFFMPFPERMSVTGFSSGSFE